MSFGTLVSVPAKDLKAGDSLFVDLGGARASIGGMEITEVFDTGHGRIALTCGEDKVWFSADDLVAIWREAQ